MNENLLSLNKEINDKGIDVSNKSLINIMTEEEKIKYNILNKVFNVIDNMRYEDNKNYFIVRIYDAMDASIKYDELESYHMCFGGTKEIISIIPETGEYRHTNSTMDDYHFISFIISNLCYYIYDKPYTNIVIEIVINGLQTRVFCYSGIGITKNIRRKLVERKVELFNEEERRLKEEKIKAIEEKIKLREEREQSKIKKMSPIELKRYKYFDPISDDDVIIFLPAKNISICSNSKNKNAFNSIKFELHLSSKHDFDYVNEWVSKRENIIIRSSLSVLSESRIFTKFRIPIKRLKVSDIQLTESKILFITFKLKNKE